MWRSYVIGYFLLGIMRSYVFLGCFNVGLVYVLEGFSFVSFFGDFLF